MSKLVDIIAALDMIHDELYMMDGSDFEDDQYSICNQVQGIIDELQSIRKGGAADG